jgi:Rrf2 family nitric oxide-sensitive transcriptional repressor
MQLTRFTDLGLRTMMLLAAGDADDRRITTRTIAVGADASEHHIAKAVARLVELGMINSRRGRVGGLSLTEAGRQASLGWLVRRLEGDADVIDCGGSRPCPLIAACRLRWVLAGAKEAFYRELDNHTLQDLAGSAVLPVVSLPLERITR